MGIEGKSLHIMTPMYGGQCTFNYCESMQKLVLSLQQYKVNFSWGYNMNESLVQRARNRMTDSYLKNNEHTHALLVDADIGFEVQDIFAMLESDLDIAGAPCVKKSFNWNRLQRTIKKNGRDYTPDEMSRIVGDYIFNWIPGVKGIQTFKVGEPLEVHNLGTGLMMVRRNVFEGYMEAYPDRWYDSKGADAADCPGPVHEFWRVAINPETRQYDSEDYWFCMDCRAIGFKVWMLPWMRTSHMGSYLFKGDMPAVSALLGEL